MKIYKSHFFLFTPNILELHLTSDLKKGFIKRKEGLKLKDVEKSLKSKGLTPKKIILLEL